LKGQIIRFFRIAKEIHSLSPVSSISPLLRNYTSKQKPMAELSSWPFDTAPHSFLTDSALFAVKSELAMRELWPEVFWKAKPPYILLRQTKIYTDYYINNSFVETKQYTFPQWADHAFVLRIKPWVEWTFVILNPEMIASLHEQDLIRLIGSEYHLMISFFSNRDILLANSYPLHNHLERRSDLLK